MAWLVMHLARIDMRSLYRHDMRAMRLKLLGSAVEFFLWIRMVVAAFHADGTSWAVRQWRNKAARISHLGSINRRWRYLRRSCPGAEFEKVLSF